MDVLDSRGGPDSELRDELAAKEDAQRDAEEAIAEGDQHPGVPSYTERATAGAGTGREGGSLSDEYAEKEGGHEVCLAEGPRN